MNYYLSFYLKCLSVNVLNNLFRNSAVSQRKGQCHTMMFWGQTEVTIFSLKPSLCVIWKSLKIWKLLYFFLGASHFSKDVFVSTICYEIISGDKNYNNLKTTEHYFWNKQEYHGWRYIVHLIKCRRELL